MCQSVGHWFMLVNIYTEAAKVQPEPKSRTGGRKSLTAAPAARPSDVLIRRVTVDTLSAFIGSRSRDAAVPYG